MALLRHLSRWLGSALFVANLNEYCRLAKIANAVREILMVRCVVHTHKTREKPPVQLAGHRYGPTVEMIKIRASAKRRAKLYSELRVVLDVGIIFFAFEKIVFSRARRDVHI